VSTCTHCKQNHLIADNQRKLDMENRYDKVEDYLSMKGIYRSIYLSIYLYLFVYEMGCGCGDRMDDV